MSHDHQPSLEDLILQKVTTSIADNLLKGVLGQLLSGRILEVVGETLIARSQNESPIELNTIVAQPKRFGDGTGVVLFNTYQHYRPGRNSIVHVDARGYEVDGVDDLVQVSPFIINAGDLDKSRTEHLPAHFRDEILRQLKGAQKLQGIKLYAFMVFGPQTQFPADFEFIQDAPHDAIQPAGLDIEGAIGDDEFQQQLNQIAALNQPAANDVEPSASSLSVVTDLVHREAIALPNGRGDFDTKTPFFDIPQNGLDEKGRLKMSPQSTELFAKLKENAKLLQTQGISQAGVDLLGSVEAVLPTPANDSGEQQHIAQPTPVVTQASVNPSNSTENWALVADIVRHHFSVNGGDVSQVLTEPAYAQACARGFVGSQEEWCVKAKITAMGLSSQAVGGQNDQPTPA